MSKIIEINSEKELEEILSEDKIVLLQFSAIWCGPCKSLSPILENLSEQEEVDVTIVKVNVDENPELSAKYGVRSIPVVFAIKNGEEVDRLVGLNDKNAYIEMINKHNESKD